MMRSVGFTVMLLLACGPALLLVAHGVFSLSGDWAKHLAETVLPGYLRASILALVLSVPIAVVIGGVGAALTHGYEFFGRRFVVFSQLMALTIPAYVAAAIWYELVDSSIAVLGGVHGAATAPVVFLLMRMGLARIPETMSFAAAALGANLWSRVWRIYLPMLSVVGLAALLLVAAAVLGDEAAARRLGVSTLAVGLLDQWQVLQREDLATLLTLLLSLVAAILMLPIGRWVLANPKLLSAEKNQRRIGVRGWRGIALFAVGMMLAMPGFFAPLALCLRWVIIRFHRVDLSSLLEDVTSTAITSLATVGIVCSLSLALIALAQPGAKAKRLEVLLWIPSLSYVIPPLVLGLAWLRLGAWFDWTGSSRWMIVSAVSIRLFPIALLPAVAAFLALPDELIDSARTLGETRAGAFRRVVIPTILPALGVGAMMVLVESVNELTLSQLLQPFGYHSLSLRIGALTAINLIRDAASWVVVSVLICLVPIWILMSMIEPDEG